MTEGERVRVRRESLGMTPGEFRTATGITAVELARIEAGTSRMSPEERKIVSVILDLEKE